MRLTTPLTIVATRPPMAGEPPAPQTDTFYPVDLDGLVVDTVGEFDLFLRVDDDRCVLLRASSHPFTLAHRERLIDNAVRTLFVRAEEYRTYTRYLEHHLDEILANPEVPSARKADFLYTVSSNVVEDCLSTPRSATIVPRTRALAGRTVDFVLRSERSLGHLAVLMENDYYTFTHSINVSVFAAALAHKVGVPRWEMTEFVTGALLHDLGKAEVPHELLVKPGKLSEDELRIVRSHVTIGERLLQEHGRLSMAALLPVSLHHEKIDGSGYPRAFRGDDIHLFGRIAAIADCFDAMTTNRAYQPAMKAFDALQQMRTTLDLQFDQHLLEVFIRLLRAPDVAATLKQKADAGRPPADSLVA